MATMSPEGVAKRAPQVPAGMGVYTVVIRDGKGNPHQEIGLCAHVASFSFIG